MAARQGPGPTALPLHFSPTISKHRIVNELKVLFLGPGVSASLYDHSQTADWLIAAVVLSHLEANKLASLRQRAQVDAKVHGTLFVGLKLDAVPLVCFVI